jgi:hypothetical protein
LRSKEDNEKPRFFFIGRAFQGEMDGWTVSQAVVVRDALISIARDGKGVKFSKQRGKKSPDFAPPKKAGKFRELHVLGHVWHGVIYCDLADPPMRYAARKQAFLGVTGVTKNEKTRENPGSFAAASFMRLLL